MPSTKNKAILASAGARKTTSLVEAALNANASKSLITTYTNEGLAQIGLYLIEKNHSVPANVSLETWFSFLLHEGARPYQNHATQAKRIRAIEYGELAPAMKYAKEREIEKHFLTPAGNIHAERLSRFVCLVNDRSSGLVFRRLEKVYKHIFIDEFQDLAGYDLEFVEGLLRSSIGVTLVTDPRQAIFSTNRSAKNRQFRRDQIVDRIQKWEAQGLLTIEYRNECYRCNQSICDFADKLFPDYPPMTSKNTVLTGHDGIFSVEVSEVHDYVRKYKPAVLRYNRTTDCMGLEALNIGYSKGRTYDRVLIFPTQGWKRYLKEKDLQQAGDRIRLYVAVTRAKFSVAFAV